MVVALGNTRCSLCNSYLSGTGFVLADEAVADQKALLHLKRGIYRLKKHLVENIISIGISPFLMNTCACIVVIFINNQLVRYGGDLAVGAYGIANSIAMIFIMFIIGLNQGMQPIAGYNLWCPADRPSYACIEVRYSLPQHVLWLRHG